MINKSLAILSGLGVEKGKKTGFYTNTPENRKLGRIGQKYKKENNISNFDKWFKNSKIVDENGKPLVVYHGTRDDFSKFGTEKTGFSNKHRLWYFSKDTSMANSFAGGSKVAFKNVGKTGTIMPVYLSIQNPKILPLEDRDAIEDVGYWATDKQLDEFEALGYDGLMLEDKSQIVALKPNQIKSATGNTGEWNIMDEDIIKAIESYHISKEEKTKIKAIVGIVFDNSAKVLLGVSTLPDFRKDKWCFPGGGHEKGETFYQTGIREVLEETGIKTKPLNLSPIIDSDIPNILFIILKKVSGQIKPNKEFSDMDWFNINNLPKDIINQNKKALTKAINLIKGQKQELTSLNFTQLKKAIKINLIKSKIGIHIDNAENRRLERVGQPYGEKKEEPIKDTNQLSDKQLHNYMMKYADINKYSPKTRDFGLMVSLTDAYLFEDIANDYNLNKLEIAILIDYVNDGYTNLNRFLKNKPGFTYDTKYMTNKANLLNRTLDKFPNHIGKVVRFYNVDSENMKQFLADYTNNEIVTMKNFMSTTASVGEYVANNTQKKNVRFNIKSKKGKAIADFSMYQHENEVLFKSNSKFKVKGVEMSNKEYGGNFVKIDLEEV